MEDRRQQRIIDRTPQGRVRGAYARLADHDGFTSHKDAEMIPVIPYSRSHFMDAQ